MNERLTDEQMLAFVYGIVSNYARVDKEKSDQIICGIKDKLDKHYKTRMR